MTPARIQHIRTRHSLTLPAGVEPENTHVGFHGLRDSQLFDIADGLQAAGVPFEMSLLTADDGTTFQHLTWVENGVSLTAYGEHRKEPGS